MTREERAWEAYAQVMRERAPAGKYAARSMLDSPSEQDKRAVAAMLAFADAEAAAMREALQFYADRDSYNCGVGDVCISDYPVMEDRGEFAREALGQ